MPSIRSRTLRAAVAMAIAAAATHAAHAQSTTSSGDQTLEQIVVLGQIIYRDRVETTPPVLEYGLDYFQRFEPLTVGDMLKRVPSVAFLSDVLEFDAVRLRGLDAGYTQILINGRKTPGSEADRSFFVDRIPAELIERIEIVRSPSADRTAEGVSGALNIVLKGDHELDGGYLRAGGLMFDDDEFRGTLGGVFGGALGDWRYTLGADVQGRYNPKEKSTDFFDADGSFAGERELESDTRDGTDYSFNASFAGPIGALRASFSAFYTRTDRDEREDVQILEGDPLELDALEAQDEDIKQDNAGVEGIFALPWSAGTTELQLSYAEFKDDIVATAFEADPGDELAPTEREVNDSQDEELGTTLSHTFEFDPGKLKLGVDYLDKQRDADIRVFEFEDGAFEEDTPPNGVFTIEETRLDPFVKYETRVGDALGVEAGLRYETTSVDVAGDAGTDSNDYDYLAPSLHLRWSLTDADRVYASVARTVRRPDFDLIAPFEVDEEPADEDTLRGNPDSEIEDPILGGERRFQNQPEYVYNVGFIQNLEAWAAAFGANCRKQDVSRQIVLGEIRDTSYEGDLEVFVEKRFGETWVARLTASNLLDLEKKEVITSYDGDSAQGIIDAMRSDDVDEIEVEHETSGPVLQLVVRANF